MIDYIHAAAYVGVVSVLLYLIPLCYLDIQFRRIPNVFLLPLIVGNIVALFVLYTNGLWVGYLIISALLTVFFTAMFLFKAFKGADAKVLILISWFCPVNMLNPFDNSFEIQHSFQIQFVAFLAGVSLLWMIYVYFKNRKAIDLVTSDKQTLFQKFNNYPRGSPWMIPIAIAFVLTVVLG